LPKILIVVLVHGGNTEPKYYLKKTYHHNRCGHYFVLHENDCIKFSLGIQCTITLPIADKQTLQMSDPWDNSGQEDYNINQTEK